MSSSLQNERCKVLFILSIVVAILSTIETVRAINLVDMPMEVPAMSAYLHATLTDANGSNKFFIQEFISASSSHIKGKIVISGEKDSYNVHYSTDFIKERLVVQGTNCSPFRFIYIDWDRTLAGIKKPLTNLILLMGPSIIYRLGHSSLVWTKVENKNIRGTIMKGATTEISNRLKITYYYKKHYNEDSGIKNPSRIEFSGYNPYSNVFNNAGDLILDIYLQKENYIDQFANEVHPLPGIGCPLYLSMPKTSLPIFKANYLHYTMYEYIQGGTTTRTYSEIHASSSNKLLRLKATLLGATTEAIYDYQLGVSYLLYDDGGCSILSGDLNSPGINSQGYFSLMNLLMVDGIQFNFLYLGKLNFEHRSGFPVDVWEATKYNVNINGKKADKAVITQYFVESQNSKIFSGYTLVSTTITLYKSDSMKKTYTLTDRITRDYMNFEEAGFEDELHDVFSLKGCVYLSSDEKLTLGFKLICDKKPSSSFPDESSCIELADKRLYEFKKDFVNYFIASKKISPLRVDSIEYNLNDNQIEMEVSFLDAINMKYIFSSKTMSVSADTLRKLETIKVANKQECLERLANIEDFIIVAIYRPSDSSCGYLTNFEDLKEDVKLGQPCSIYHFPLHNLHRISQEIQLDKIHDTFLKDVGSSYSLFDGTKYVPYKFIDITDKTKNQVAESTLYYMENINKKLKDIDKVTVSLPNVKTGVDCYRACRNSEKLECNTFSFCESKECKVSSISSQGLKEENIENEASCTIYAVNYLGDYSAVNERKFKTQNSPSMTKSQHLCAESCHTSPDCYSFQLCGEYCSFGGFYTDAATEYDEECKIYIPKVSEKYEKTGNKIVSDVIHTEMNLNFEQCAALCNGWSDGDTGCKSFNYCPKSKTESSCSLTKFSVKSSGTKTSEGGECSNYEFKVESTGKKNKESSSTEVTKGTSSSGAFGIIMLFLFIGGLLGFAGPFAYSKVKELRNASEANESFTWERQVDEQADNIQTNKYDL